MKIEKGLLTKVPLEHQIEENAIAFQKVKITFKYFGQEISNIFDTRILANGEQRIIGGNSFIEHDYLIAN
jgi:hypothetical protein